MVFKFVMVLWFCNFMCFYRSWQSPTSFSIRSWIGSDVVSWWCNLCSGICFFIRWFQPGLGNGTYIYPWVLISNWNCGALFLIDLTFTWAISKYLVLTASLVTSIRLFLLIPDVVIDRLLSGSGLTIVSKKIMAPSSLLSSTVNLMTGSTLLIVF